MNKLVFAQYKFTGVYNMVANYGLYSSRCFSVVGNENWR